MPKEKIEKLLALTKSQEIALKNDEIDTFKSLLNEREEVIDELKALEQMQPEVRSCYDQEVMQQIKEIESSNQIEFKKQLEQAKQKLREIREMKKHEVHYNNPYNRSWEEGIFFDKKEYR